MSDKIIAMAKDAGMGWPFPLDVCGLSRFRDLVLEEAAVVCDAWSRGKHEEGAWEQVHAADMCGNAIRALKGVKP